MKKVILEIEMPDDFEVGRCGNCRFARYSDQCKLTALLTNGSCLLNCLCPLKIGTK